MCDKCDGQIMLLVGEIKGIVEGIKGNQADMLKTVTENRIAVQKEIKDLSIDMNKFKIKVFGIGSIFGTLSGFLSRFIPS